MHWSLITINFTQCFLNSGPQPLWGDHRHISREDPELSLQSQPNLLSWVLRGSEKCTRGLCMTQKRKDRSCSSICLPAYLSHGFQQQVLAMQLWIYSKFVFLCFSSFFCLLQFPVVFFSKASKVLLFLQNPVSPTIPLTAFTLEKCIGFGVVGVVLPYWRFCTWLSAELNISTWCLISE